MTQSDIRLVVKVSTTDGKISFHQYPLPGDARQRGALIDDLIKKTNRFHRPHGAIVLHNPLTIYNITTIVKIEWQAVGSSTEVAEVEQRIAGLNIPR